MTDIVIGKLYKVKLPKHHDWEVCWILPLKLSITYWDRNSYLCQVLGISKSCNDLPSTWTSDIDLGAYSFIENDLSQAKFDCLYQAYSSIGNI